MNKQYIRFEEGNQDSLDKACKLAEKLGYKVWNVAHALRFEGQGMIDCDKNGMYYTSSNTRESLINIGYTELIDEEIPKQVKPVLTYETIIRRSDGVEFKKDTIDGKTLEEVTNQILEHKTQAKHLASLLKFHSKHF